MAPHPLKPDKKPALNPDLWERLLDLIAQHTVRLHWVKGHAQNVHNNRVYTAKVESFTHGKVYDVIVSKDFLKPEDRVLLIDDFLANGSALQGLKQRTPRPDADPVRGLFA